MPVYHSKRNEEKWEEASGCALCPFRSNIKGTALVFEPNDAEDEDIIDETLTYFRANVLFRNFEVRN
jgi:actin related protein 2/3 complex subunit 3